MPGCALSKVAQYIPRETTGYASVGEFITYEITATNNGNVDVKEAAMIDAMFRSSDGECQPWYLSRGLAAYMTSPAVQRCNEFTLMVRENINDPETMREHATRRLINDEKYTLSLFPQRHRLTHASSGSYAMECSDGIPTPWLVDAEFVCRPVYTITQADIDAGVVKNTVT